MRSRAKWAVAVIALLAAAGAVEAVDLAASRYPTALASGSHPTLIEAVTTDPTMEGKFKVVVAADDVGDPHGNVVGDHRQHVGRGAVGADDDELVVAWLDGGDRKLLLSGDNLAASLVLGSWGVSVLPPRLGVQVLADDIGELTLQVTRLIRMRQVPEMHAIFADAQQHALDADRPVVERQRAASQDLVEVAHVVDSS